MIEERTENELIVHPPGAVGSSLLWFENYLKASAIRPHNGCALSIAMRRLREHRDDALANKTRYFETDKAAFEYFAASVGADLLTKAIHRAAVRGFELPTDRLAMLVSGDCILTRPARSATARNKTWESLLACVVSTFASDVRFDEPDVTCNFEGGRVGIAAKVLYSEQRLHDRVLEGVGQGRRENLNPTRKNSPAPTFVLVDVASIYPYEAGVEDRDEAQVAAFSLSRFRSAPPLELLESLDAAINRWIEGRFDLSRLVNDMRRASPHVAAALMLIPLLVYANSAPLPVFRIALPVGWSRQSTDERFAWYLQRAFNYILAPVDG